MKQERRVGTIIDGAIEYAGKSIPTFMILSASFEYAKGVS